MIELIPILGPLARTDRQQAGTDTQCIHSLYRGRREGTQVYHAVPAKSLPKKRFFGTLLKEAAKKVLFLVAGPLRGGLGLKGCATKEKRTFFMRLPLAKLPIFEE